MSTQDFMADYWPQIESGTEAERKAALHRLIRDVSDASKNGAYVEGYKDGFNRGFGEAASLSAGLMHSTTAKLAQSAQAGA